MAGTLTRGYSFGATESVTNAKLHSLVDSATITGIVGTEIASNAAIPDSKLDTISSAGKVSGASLISLANVPSGAGVIPAANLTSVAQKGANSDITSLTGLTTALTFPQGGTGGSKLGWVSFNGTGTVAINSSLNVTSITDNGTGDYTINWTTAFANANYCVIATVSSHTDDSQLTIATQYNGVAAGSVRVYVNNLASARTDATYVFVMAIGS